MKERAHGKKAAVTVITYKISGTFHHAISTAACFVFTTLKHTRSYFWSKSEAAKAESTKLHTKVPIKGQWGCRTNHSWSTHKPKSNSLFITLATVTLWTPPEVYLCRRYMRTYLWWSLSTFVVIHVPGKIYRRQLRSLLLCLCDDFWALVNSLVCRFCTGWAIFDWPLFI